MNVMTRELPNLQQITLGIPGQGHKYNDGEDPNEIIADRTDGYDIEIISSFSKLRKLSIHHAGLNGRYPFLFNSFPLLQKLTINYYRHCSFLKWDLEMLAGFPMLNELKLRHNCDLTGSINSLRVLKDTLEKVHIAKCENVEGNLMDLADFPNLKELDLRYTPIRGDIQDIGENDFSSLEHLVLPETVYGGHGYEAQRISDAPDVVRAVYAFNKQRPNISMMFAKWHAKLSEDSPDWYEDVQDEEDTPPFCIRFVKAGSRIGYRWATRNGYPCDVNWLDPEPDGESTDYAKYIEELEQINSEVNFYLNFYKGLYHPPTEEEYHRLVEEETQRILDDE